MNITCKTRELAEEIRLLTKVISDKSPIPVLSSVLFEAGDGMLALTATDLEVGLISICDAVITANGRVTLPAMKLLALLTQMTTEEVTIAINDKGQAVIASGTFKSRLQTWAADEFPIMPTVAGEKIAFDGDAFRELIAKTNYAVTDKNQMYLIKGAMFNVGFGDAMGIIATDGTRISIASVPCAGINPVSVLIPGKTLDTLLALHPEGIVSFSRTDNHLFFSMGSRALFSRVIDGKFPNFSHVPKTLPNKAQANAHELAMALRRVAAMIEKVPAVTLMFSQGLLRMLVRNIEVGDAVEQIPITYDGPDVKLCMNYTYMLDFIKHADHELVSIEFKDDSAPMIMTDGDFMNIILGMHP
jgi:DNA polymerase-3 subunit beta